MRTHPMVMATIAPLLMVALAACGSSGSGDGVATAGSKAPRGGSSASASGDDSGVKYTQCMREHGVNLPDPEPGKPPQVINGDPGSTLGKAYEACKQLLPAASEDTKISPEDLEKVRQYTKCLRDNGVDVPDPDPDGGITAKAGQPKMEAADKICQSKLPGQQK
jgi:hypothetical protein